MGDGEVRDEEAVWVAMVGCGGGRADWGGGVWRAAFVEGLTERFQLSVRVGWDGFAGALGGRAGEGSAASGWIGGRGRSGLEEGARVEVEGCREASGDADLVLLAGPCRGGWRGREEDRG